MKKLLHFGLLLLIPLCSVSQNTRQYYQDRIYHAFVHKDMKVWEQALGEMEQMFVRQPSYPLLYDILLAQYGLIGYYLGVKEDKLAASVLEKAFVNVSNLGNQKDFLAASKALEGAFIGYRIALSPLRAVYLGPRSLAAIDKGIEIDRANPNVWIEKGNATFYAPSAFGGSKSGSIAHYLEAIKLLEKNLANNHRWLYLNTLVALAKAYAETGQRELAIQTYRKSLAYEPDFAWVKEDLLPKLMKTK